MSLLTLLMKSVSFSPESTVPVGLFGLQSQITLVLSVIALSIASASTEKFLSTGTFTTFPPLRTVELMYQPKDGSAYIASSPSSIKAEPIRERISNDPLPKMNFSPGTLNLSERVVLSPFTLKSG